MARRMRPANEARIGDWSTQEVARRWRIGASRRIRWTHTADQADVITLASTAIIAPVAPAKAVAAGTTQNPLFGLTAQASRAPVPALPTAPRRLRADEHDPEPGGQTERAQELADRRQAPHRDQRECRRRGQDLNPQHHRPGALDGRTAVRRGPAQDPSSKEADQAEHGQHCALLGLYPPRVGRTGRRYSARQCTLNEFVRCWRRRLSGVICLRTPSTVVGRLGPCRRVSWPPTRSNIGTSSASCR